MTDERERKAAEAKFKKSERATEGAAETFARLADRYTAEHERKNARYGKLSRSTREPPAAGAGSRAASGDGAGSRGATSSWWSSS